MSKPQPKDQVLYDKIKKQINTKYKPSAYRSGLLVKKYKEEYLKNIKTVMHRLETDAIQI